MNPTWSLRRLSTVDDSQIEALADVLIDCVEGGASVSFMLPLARDRAVEFWRRVAQDVAAGRRALLVAEDECGVCGTVQLVFELEENQPHRADLAKMLVHRRVRRQGLGAALMRAAEETARQCGKTLLVLDAVTGGDGARLYERLGWVRVGDVPNFALMPRGEPCSTTYYYRDLRKPVAALSSDTSLSSPDIRPATTTDFAAIFELLKQLWTDQTLDLEKMSVAFGSQLTTPNHFAFCCEMSGNIVGFATLSIRHSLWQQAGIGYVGELVVREADRGHGHGKALLDFLSEFAAARGCTRLELDSGFHRTDSHAIYEHCGLIKRAFVFSRPLGGT